MTRMRFLVWLVIGLALAAPAQQSNDPATVSGRVFDAQGLPLTNAKISIFPMIAFSGGLPTAITDKEGHYRLVSPPFGDTWFSAVKETAGYPDTNALLFAPVTDDRPKVFLGPGSKFELDIHLGPPDGILEGVVVNAATKTRIANARIALRREQPEAIYSGSLPQDAHFLFALPSVPIGISITAPGYLPWTYKDPKIALDKITLSGSDHRTLSVELTPEVTAQQQPEQPTQDHINNRIAQIMAHSLQQGVFTTSSGVRATLIKADISLEDSAEIKQFGERAIAPLSEYLHSPDYRA
jgi:hypothetical protein